MVDYVQNLLPTLNSLLDIVILVLLHFDLTPDRESPGLIFSQYTNIFIRLHIALYI